MNEITANLMRFANRDNSFIFQPDITRITKWKSDNANLSKEMGPRQNTVNTGQRLAQFIFLTISKRLWGIDALC